MEKEKNSNKGLVVIIVILVIAIIGAGSYIAYNEFYAKKDNKETSEKSNNSNAAISEEEKTKLLKIVATLNNYNLGKYDNLDISQISNQEKLAFVSYVVLEEKLNTEDSEFPSMDGYSGKQVTEIYQKYFGTNSTITNGDIYLTPDGKEILFKYNQEKDIYERKYAYGAPVKYLTTSSYNFFVEGTKNNDTYTIKVQSLFITPCDDICIDTTIAGSYKDAADKKKIEGTESWYKQSGEILYLDKTEVTNSEYEQIKDKLPTYTYVFTIENGNFILKSKTLNG